MALGNHRDPSGRTNKVAVVATVRNEATSIDLLLQSLLACRRLPDEIVIVDGGSTDGTLEALQHWTSRLPQLRVLSAPGSNIAQGRNSAITAATADWIAVTDAGVRLDPDWLAALLLPVEQAVGRPPDVASGFFEMAPTNLFELALGATTLPSATEIKPERFLPSSRSVLFSRASWSAAGGYPEWLDYCEDVVFDLALRRNEARFAWAPNALVYFRPRPSWAAFCRQYYRYARGDGKALLWRKRHAIRYGSYAALAALLATAARRWRDPAGQVALVVLGAGAAAYLRAPYRRLAQWTAAAPQHFSRRQRLCLLALLPLLRGAGDAAKMLGYPAGLWWRWQHRYAILHPQPLSSSERGATD